MSKKIEEHVNRSFTNATPDISNRVIADCQAKQVRRTVPAKRSNGMFWKFATFALALVLVVTCIVSGVQLAPTAQAASVTFDVNPSIELKIDSQNRVIKVVANNADAEIIVQSMDLTGSTLDTAVYAIIGSMTAHGYLTDVTNSVLVSVDTKKEDLYNQIINTVTSKIEVTLGEHNIQSAVVAQWIKNKDAIASQANQIAKTYNISTGKATLIAKILDASKDESSTGFTEQDLVNRTVTELALILARYQKENIQGTVSTIDYIQRDEAVEKALAEVQTELSLAELSTDMVSRLKVDFDIEDGQMVYEIEFEYSSFEYEIDVNAKTGEVVKYEKDEADGNNATLGSLAGLVGDELKNTIQTAIKDVLGIVDVTNLSVIVDDDEIEVAFQTSTHRYELELSKNGRIVSVERKPLKDTTAYLPEETIKQIALEKVFEITPHLRDEKYTVTVECELDDGVYEVEVKFTYFVFTYEYDLKINPTSGNVIRIKLA